MLDTQLLPIVFRQWCYPSPVPRHDADPRLRSHSGCLGGENSGGHRYIYLPQLSLRYRADVFCTSAVGFLYIRLAGMSVIRRQQAPEKRARLFREGW